MSTVHVNASSLLPIMPLFKSATCSREASYVLSRSKSASKGFRCPIPTQKHAVQAGSGGAGQITGENDVFAAHSVQLNVPIQVFTENLKNLIIPALGEYKSKWVTTAAREFKGTIRAEIERASRKIIQPVLDELYTNTPLEVNIADQIKTENRIDNDHPRNVSHTMPSDLSDSTHRKGREIIHVPPNCEYLV
jgi:hypothetical protein